MEFHDKNPGAVQFGNFINYYQFNSAEERIRRLEGLGGEYWLPASKASTSINIREGFEKNANCDRTQQPEMQLEMQPEMEAEREKTYLLLDVGCNVGCLTEELYRHCKEIMPQHNIRILAIDCDPKLVECARNRKPSQEAAGITYQCVNIMKVEDRQVVQEYLQKYRRRRFDAVCCFSITMWIHLNHHDKGLQEFLQLMSDWAEVLLLEPQPWKCYQTAQRRMSRAGKPFALFGELKWRSNIEQEIDNYLRELLGRRKTHRTTATKWQRSISFYR